jgi:hypothetical protein
MTEAIKTRGQSAVDSARSIPKRLTAGVAIGVFELFLQIWPNVMSEHWQGITYKAIGIVSATGIADWAWRNRKQAWTWIKNKFTKKKN